MKKWRAAAICMMVVIFVINGLPAGKEQNSIYNPLARAILVISGEMPYWILFQSDYTEQSADFPEGIDKFVHFTLYFFLSMLFFQGFGIKPLKVLILVLFSLFDELHQIPAPGRCFSAYDLLFDTLGIFFVYYFLNEQHKS